MPGRKKQEVGPNQFMMAFQWDSPKCQACGAERPDEATFYWGETVKACPDCKLKVARNALNVQESKLSDDLSNEERAVKALPKKHQRELNAANGRVAEANSALEVHRQYAKEVLS